MFEPFAIKTLLHLIPDGKFFGDENHLINQPIALNDAIGKDYSNSITWISDALLTKETIDLNSLKVGLIICSSQMHEKLNAAKGNYLLVENPRGAFVKIVSEKFKKVRTPKIEATAIIHPDAKIGSNCYIGHHVVIEENCSIGSNCSILHNTVILANTVIGDNVSIGCNNTIGNYGFGYEKNAEGDYQLFEHIGNVVIHDNVEIHNNTCIDRGVLGSTIIHENVKIDNLVHIAHGVIIGRNSLIIANALIGGSAVIGENSWVAPSATIKNKVVIGNNNMIGMGAVVLKNTDDNTTMIGNPAITMEDYKKKKNKD
jgi:UDP-3-O-[3-hydroxymyristoyl] glucosamine N-acyltransferase